MSKEKHNFWLKYPRWRSLLWTSVTVVVGFNVKLPFQRTNELFQTGFFFCSVELFIRQQARFLLFNLTLAWVSNFSKKGPPFCVYVFHTWIFLQPTSAKKYELLKGWKRKKKERKRAGFLLDMPNKVISVFSPVSAPPPPHPLGKYRKGRV